MTVRELLESMDSHEISEWIAYFKSLESPEKNPAGLDLGQQVRKALAGRKKKK